MEFQTLHGTIAPGVCSGATNSKTDMSSIAIDSHLQKALRFYQASIGKKAVMAVTAVVLFGYVVAHLAGNLQVYAGAEQMDRYATFLHSM
jgi:succinate dehydrogenase / fumarate reductase cytochrome b subunit